MNEQLSLEFTQSYEGPYKIVEARTQYVIRDKHRATVCAVSFGSFYASYCMNEADKAKSQARHDKLKQRKLEVAMFIRDKLNAP